LDPNEEKDLILDVKEADDKKVLWYIMYDDWIKDRK
jgi:hypothetical protein